MSRISHRAAHRLATACLLLLVLPVPPLGLAACAPAVVRHNEAGNERFADGVYERAIDEYRLAQVAEPDQAEPYYNAANAYNRTRQISAALAQTEQALKTADPELATQAWYNLGNAYFDTEQWPVAIEAYKEALRLSPGDPGAKHNLELALQRLEEQQQQEQKQQSRGGQQEPTPTPAGETEQSEGQEGDESATPQPSGRPEENEGMTPEQAIQLLKALFDDSQTLQERLREMHRVPGPPPERDW